MPVTVMALSLAVFLFAPPAVAQSMAIPGKFDVSGTGAATYSIPISVPPGTAGMTPALALSFSSQGANSSQGSNGIVGMGWSLSGLPSINRCPQTVAQDGVGGGVNFDSNDRFCLDALRLVAIGGAYGADGTEYRTEMESFTRVISHGIVGTGPAWFEVHTKSGQIMEFGHTADSLVPAQGKPTARSWAVNKVSDTKGNYFTVTYTNDTTNGQAYPIEIDYTGNAAATPALAPYNKVQLVYATRPDITAVNIAGSALRTTVRLTDIQTFAGSNLVADYKLTYQQSGATGNSEVISVGLCAGDGSCLPATQLTWANGSNGSFSAVNGPNGPSGVVFVGDFNGDGKADLFSYADPECYCGSSQIWLSNGDGTFNISNVNNPDSYSYAVILGDFNGDGKTDILWSSGGNPPSVCTGTSYIWFSNGDGTFQSQPLAGAPCGRFLFVGDFNGDGKTDIFFCNNNYDYINLASCTGGGYNQIWLSNNDGTFQQINVSLPTLPYGNWIVPYVGDFNGDRKSDIIWCGGGGGAGSPDACQLSYISFSNGDGTFQWVGLSSGVNGSVFVADFNGDGRSDLLLCNIIDNYTQTGACQGTTSSILLSNGDGTFTQSTVNNPPAQPNSDFYNTRVLYFGDFNGDGKTDVMWCGVPTDSSGVPMFPDCGQDPLTLWTSNGDGTFQSQSESSNGGTGTVGLVGDFNGDGKADMLWPGSPSHLWLSDGVPTDHVSTITTGLGTTTTFTYQPLTNGSVYTKDTTSTYPLVDVQVPTIYVVSRVDTSNGVGGTYSTTYKYAGAKADLSGRGFLGFRQVQARDLQTNILATTNFRQDYPYIGLTASTAKTLGSLTLNSIINTYQFSNAGGAAMVSTPSNASAPYRVSVAQSVASSSDLDGTALPTVTMASQYDAYGNPTQVVVSTPDGFSKTTTNTYTNDTVNWFLGRLTGAAVTSTTP